jgi:hypothetical protein
MTKNPFLNALVALVYIVLVVSGLFYSPIFVGDEPNILIPISVLSLFVFSAASMAYIFLYQPLQLFLEGEKKKAVDLFLKTLGAFAVCAIIFASIGFYVTNHFAVNSEPTPKAL